MPCLLCGAQETIDDSHVIPKFAYRRLNQGSPVNAFVHSGNINRFIQDGWTGPYFCKACEARMNRWETSFVNRILDPFQKRGQKVFNYDENLGLFCASVHFRNLAYLICRNPGQASAAARTLHDALKQMCLAQTSTAPGVFQYLQLIEPVKTLDHFSPGINTYLFESIDPSVQQSINGQPNALSFVKLPGALLVTSDFDLSTVTPPGVTLAVHSVLAGGVHSIKAQSGGLLIGAKEIVTPKADEIQANYTAMGAKQVAKLQARIKADSNREVTRAHKSYVLDRYLLLLTRLRDWGLPRLLSYAVAQVLHFFRIMPPPRRS